MTITQNDLPEFKHEPLGKCEFPSGWSRQEIPWLCGSAACWKVSMRWPQNDVEVWLLCEEHYARVRKAEELSDTEGVRYLRRARLTLVATALAHEKK
jgi:hypothetical protein